MTIALAIEFGGQSIKAVLVDGHGQTYSFNRTALNQEHPPYFDDFSRDFKAMIRATKGETQISSVGIAHPNPCKPENLIFMLTQKPAYKHINGIPLKDLVIESTGLSDYHTIYDAGAAGLGELWQGDIQEEGRFLLLTLGTGLGAVFMEDGLIVTGHQIQGIPKSGELWDYQYWNTDLENTTGTTKAAVSIYRRFGGTDPDILSGNLTKLALTASENKDNGIARKTFAEFGRRLGNSLAPVIKQFCPKTVILSGNITLAFDLFKQSTINSLRAQLIGSNVETEIVPSELIDRGGLLGAAFRAFYPDRTFRLEATRV